MSHPVLPAKRTRTTHGPTREAPDPPTASVQRRNLHLRHLPRDRPERPPTVRPRRSAPRAGSWLIPAAGPDRASATAEGRRPPRRSRRRPGQHSSARPDRGGGIARGLGAGRRAPRAWHLNVTALSQAVTRSFDGPCYDRPTFEPLRPYRARNTDVRTTPDTPPTSGVHRRPAPAPASARPGPSRTAPVRSRPPTAAPGPDRPG